MIICSCNAISDTSVKASVHSEKSPRTPGAVYRCLGCRPNCGRCYATVRAIIDDALTQAGAGVGPAGSTEATIVALHRDEHRHAHTHEAGSCEAGCSGCAAA
jgi:bacterioferritin-associated ferredoxin